VRLVPGRRGGPPGRDCRPPPYEFGAFDDLDDAVRAAIARVRSHPFLPHRDRVRGFVYDVDTSRLREVVV
jgi:carbonic anhydrase